MQGVGGKKSAGVHRVGVLQSESALALWLGKMAVDSWLRVVGQIGL